jgi:hypothetical protein
MSSPVSAPGRRSLGDRLVSLKGAAWKALLRVAEAFAAMVAEIKSRYERRLKEILEC